MVWLPRMLGDVMTSEQRAVLAHVVIDPDQWYAHAVATFGEEKAARALAEKVTRWSAEYASASTLPGYKTRAQRDQ